MEWLVILVLPFLESRYESERIPGPCETFDLSFFGMKNYERLNGTVIAVFQEPTHTTIAPRLNLSTLEQNYAENDFF